MNAFRRPLAPVVLALAGIVAAAPGSTAQAQERTTQAPAPHDVLVRVTNYNLQDVDIYLLAGGQRVRLGMVTTFGSASYALPTWAVRSDLRLLAHPIGGARTTATDAVSAVPGQRIDWTIENNLAQSSLWVS